MSRNPDIVFLSNYIKNVLYFAVFKSGRVPVSCCNTHYFCIDDDLIYENYYLDFGPLNISCVYKYCRLLNDKINLHSHKQVLIHYTTTDPRKKANAAFLLACFGVLYLSLSADEAFKPLVQGQYLPFQDACPQKSPYTITILNCLDALVKARDFKFFNFQDFNVAEYMKLDTLEGGDLNWIVPGKFLAFIGPVDNTHSVYHQPEMYVSYFVQNNVKIVIRLNKKLYDSSAFTKNGILHYDLYFPDGSCPQKHIVMKFLEISEEATGAIAVHCKAGLGRTGTLIGCYLIKHYRMTAHEAIAWMRICRPGSVIGHQQEWLERIETWLIKQGNMYRRRMFQDANRFPKHKFGIYSFKMTYLSRPILSKSPSPNPSRKFTNPLEQSASRPPISRRGDGSCVGKDFEKKIKNKEESPEFNLRQKCLPQNQTIIIKDNASRQHHWKMKSGDDFEIRMSRPATRLPKHLKEDFLKSDKSNKVVQHSCVKPNKNHQLQSLIKISTPHYRLSESHNETTKAAFIDREPMEQLRPMFRRRLGRSPSPHVTRKINEESRSKNTPAMPQSRQSKLNNDYFLAKPKVSNNKKSSMGAVSLDGQRSPPLEHRASSVRSDERPIATQGDLLNSIKYFRRLKESINNHHLKTLDKYSMTSDIIACGACDTNESKTLSMARKPKLYKGSEKATGSMQQGSFVKHSSRSNSPKMRRPAQTLFY